MFCVFNIGQKTLNLTSSITNVISLSTCLCYVVCRASSLAVNIAGHCPLHDRVAGHILQATLGSAHKIFGTAGANRMR